MKFYIYRIRRTNYIGSTTNIKSRFEGHKSRCYNKNSVRYYFKVYKYIRANNLKIKPKIYATYEVHGTKEFNSKMKALVEQFYINKYDTINNGLNTYRAFISNRDKREKGRQWQLNNKEHFKKVKRKWYLKNKEKIKKHIAEKVKCDKCRETVCRGGLLKHQRTDKCKRIYNNNISNNNIENETKKTN